MELWTACLALVVALLWACARWTGMLRGGRFGSIRRKSQCRQHFMEAAHLLARARKQSSGGSGSSSSVKSKSNKLARDAIRECNAVISCEPGDAAAHIVKALALQHIGQPTAALRSLNTALSPPASKSLSQSERVEALIKRAGITLDVIKNKRGAKLAIADLEQCLELDPSDSAAAITARQMLSDCYRRLGGGGDESADFSK